jgi:hypothetical protein
MRFPMRFFDAIPRWAAILLVLACLKTVHAQTSSSPIQNPTIPTRPSVPGASNRPMDDDSPMNHQIEEQQMLKRNVQRQQQIVDETSRLLTLAQQLKAEMDKSGKDATSASVAKKAEEIERLAKSVKDKMREAQ